MIHPFVLGWALLTIVTGLLQTPETPFTLGVLRRDALIIPIASYDGKRWDNDWPVPGDGFDVPMNVSSVPSRWWGPAGRRETWQVWSSGASPQSVTVRQPDWIRAYCQKQVGLRTDYQPRVWPPNPDTNPFPKDGLAVSPPNPVDPIEVLPAESSERDDLLETIHGKFAEQEAEVLGNWRTAYIRSPRLVAEAPSEKELRAMPPMTIEALYAYGSTRRTYFVESVREYRKAGACTAMSFATGWATRKSGKFSVESTQVSLNACDRGGVGYMLPLGVMSLPTGTFWIAQISGRYRESYSIRDISGREQKPERGRTEWSTPGGAC